MRTENTFLSTAIKLGIGVGSTFVSAAVFLFTGAWVAYASGDPDSLVFPLAMAALALSMTVGGFVTAKVCDPDVLSPILSALLCGVICAAVIFLIGLFPSADESGVTGYLKPVILILSVLLCTLGGVIGKPRGRKRPRLPRRR